MAGDIYQRQVIQDPLAQRLGAPQQPNSIPLSGISTPRQPDLSQIGEGERVISKLLGGASGILSQYVEKNREQWELDGKLLYAQGAAEDEIRSSGNQYTVAGFLSMKTQAQTAEFYQNELNDIDTKYRNLAPTEYRALLMERHKAIADTAQDDYSRQLLGAAAGESFPKLVAAQVKAHNAWKQEETYNSFREAFLARGTMKDPENPNGGLSGDEIRKLAQPESSGLPMELHKKAVAEVLRMSLDNGDTRIAKALAGADNNRIQINKLPPAQKLADGALGVILRNELHADGVIRVHEDGDGQAIAGINSIAYPEEFKQASTILKEQGQTAALNYARDFYRTNVIERNGVEKLPAEIQDVVADGLVNHWSGFQTELLNAAKNGASREQLIAMRRNEYMRLAEANPTKYGKNLTGWIARLDSLQGAGYKASLQDTQAENFVLDQQLRSNLIKNGYDASEITSVITALHRNEQKMDSEFNKQRILHEQEVLNSAEAEGNLPGILQRIDDVAKTYDYSDRWKNEMSNKAVRAVETHTKLQKEYARLDTIANAGQLSYESPEKQRIAIDRYRAEVIGKYTALAANDEAAAQNSIRKDMTDFLVRNGVVDPIWKQSIASGLSGNILTTDGKGVDPAALKAYEDLKWLKRNAPFAYMQNYLGDESTQKLFAQAEVFDMDVNSDQALLKAASMLTAKRDGVVSTQTVPMPVVAQMVDKKIDETFNPGLFSFIDRNQAANAYDVKDEDVARWKANPFFKSAVNALANTYIQSDLSGQLTPEAHVNRAVNVLSKRAEMAPSGNILLSGSDKTIREQMGFNNANATNLVFKAIKSYAHRHGREIFGSDYRGYSIDPDKQAQGYLQRNPDSKVSGKDDRLFYQKAMDYFTDFPASYMTWDSERQGLHWELMVEDDMGNLVGTGNSQFIPASVLYEDYIQSQAENRKDNFTGLSQMKENNGK